MKSLVVFFSRPDENYAVGNVAVGNTEILAHEIARRVRADEFQILPREAYPASYTAAVDRATMERSENARPEYTGELTLADSGAKTSVADLDLAAYDTIFLGYPIWWGDLPMVVYSFLENHDFAGKTVIPFNTHEGSGNSGTYAVLKNELSGAELKGDGFNLSGSTARTPEGLAELNAWLDGLGL